MLQARRVGSAATVGSFQIDSLSGGGGGVAGLNESENDITTYTCDSKADTLLASYAGDVSNQSYIWTPPDYDSGLVQFM